MNTNRAPALLAPGLAAAAFLLTLPADRALAAESYDSCTGYVDSVPAVITTQGTWCLRQDLATAVTSGAAITIATNNATLDCNHFKLGGLAAGSGTAATGIHLVDRLNATVRNCTVRGFYRGVHLQGENGGGHLVERSRFDGNTHVGVQVEGTGNALRENLVVDTGGSTVNGEAYGVRTLGPADLIDNNISGVHGSGLGPFNAYGIWSGNNYGGRIIGNGVRGIYPGPDATAGGIFLAGLTSDSIVRSNDVSSDSTQSGIGIRCVDNDTRIKDNIVVLFELPFFNCGDAGGNDFVIAP